MTTRTTRREAVAARRLEVRAWRDPRLLAGVLLVLGCALVGGWLWAAGDDSVQVWSAARDTVAGDPVERDDLTVTSVRLGDATEHYLRHDEPLPESLDALVWSRGLTAGALVERSALVPRGERDASELPLNVTAGALPDDLARGQLVDVWVGPGPGQDPNAASRRLLERVRVVATGADGTASGGTLARTVLVDVAAESLDDDTMSALTTGHVTLVRVG